LRTLFVHNCSCPQSSTPLPLRPRPTSLTTPAPLPHARGRPSPRSAPLPIPVPATPDVPLLALTSPPLPARAHFPNQSCTLLTPVPAARVTHLHSCACPGSPNARPPSHRCCPPDSPRHHGAASTSRACVPSAYHHTASGARPSPHPPSCPSRPIPHPSRLSAPVHLAVRTLVPPQDATASRVPSLPCHPPSARTRPRIDVPIRRRDTLRPWRFPQPCPPPLPCPFCPASTSLQRPLRTPIFASSHPRRRVLLGFGTTPLRAHVTAPALASLLPRAPPAVRAHISPAAAALVDPRPCGVPVAPSPARVLRGWCLQLFFTTWCFP
jgi:hypothetical protein